MRVSTSLHRISPGMDLDFLDKFSGSDQELTIQLIEIFSQTGTWSNWKIKL